MLGFSGIGGLVWVLARVPVPPTEPPIQSTVLVDAKGQEELAVLSGAENRLSVPLDEVPVLIRQTVLAAEDRDFYEHGGVDVGGILRALWVDIRAGDRRQGGSTITQQYVKNTHVGNDPTVWRKVREAAIAMRLERDLAEEEPGLAPEQAQLRAKDKILERYLNSVYFGRGAYGIKAGARAWFNRDLGELAPEQVAYLVALVRAPSAGDVDKDPEFATRLRAGVLDSMAAADLITAADAAAMNAKPVAETVAPAAGARSTMTLKGAGADYFVDLVRRELASRLGPDGEDLVRRGGLRVQTTLNFDAQRQAYAAVYGLLNRPEDPAGALVSLDRQGRVVALVGGRDFGSSQVNLAAGTAGGGSGRQGGSTFKIFALAETVDRGYSLGSTFPGPAQLILPKADNGADWEVNNYEDAGYGQLDLVAATVNSVNTVYAQLITATDGQGKPAVGAQGVVDMARRLGVSAPLSPVPSVALGTQGVSVLDMATAYNTLATEGLRIEPRLIDKVFGPAGEIALEPPPPERVLAPDKARRINGVLAAVVERGSGAKARIPGTAVWGKTGTSDDFGDAWFVGSTDRLTTAVWMGHADSRRPMVNVHCRGGGSGCVPKVSGGTLPATIFRLFTEKATRFIPVPDGARLPTATSAANDPGNPLPGCCAPEPEPEEEEEGDGKDGGKGDDGKDAGKDRSGREGDGRAGRNGSDDDGGSGAGGSRSNDDVATAPRPLTGPAGGEGGAEAGPGEEEP
ncbi:MAG: transglycosylase domain-containing protein [Acidimicrobiales bacterium]